MTFRESEYPLLLEELSRLAQRYPNPGLLREAFAEVLRMQQQIPYFPGIISTCLQRSIRSRALPDVETGEKVLLQTETGEIFGEVAEIDEEYIVLAGVVEETLRKRVPRSGVKGVIGIEPNSLAAAYPELVPD